jgi:hypothetical protein
MHSSEFDMVVYWQWVHACLPGTCRQPAAAWRALDMTPANARDAIDKTIVPLEIYKQALRRALDEGLLARTVSDGYQPRPDLPQYLTSISPRMNSSEMDMVIYWQWVHAAPRDWQKTPAEGWRDLYMTPANAADAIQKRIVPMEIYPDAYARSQESAKAAAGKSKAAAAGKPKVAAAAKPKAAAAAASRGRAKGAYAKARPSRRAAAKARR